MDSALRDNVLATFSLCRSDSGPLWPQCRGKQQTQGPGPVCQMLSGHIERRRSFSVLGSSKILSFHATLPLLESDQGNNMHKPQRKKQHFSTTSLLATTGAFENESKALLGRTIVCGEVKTWKDRSVLPHYE